MREILFRGQTRKKGQKVWMGGTPVDGQWVYGGVLQGIGDFSVIYGGKNANDLHEDFQKWCVYTDTLGQFTGLTDKNGKKIFEGDIVDILHNGVYECYWDEGNFEYGFKNETESFGIAYAEYNSIVVIGNIHDNPELLDGERKGDGDV